MFAPPRNLQTQRRALTRHLQPPSRRKAALVSSKIDAFRTSATRRQQSTAAAATTSGVKRPRGRPPKVEEKPRCIVRPMQRGAENRPRGCAWASCAHIAASASSLKLHVERDHLSHLMQFVCRWSGCTRVEPFKAVYMLRLHLRTHLGDKPYNCTVSSLDFRSAAYLRRACISVSVLSKDLHTT